MTWPPALSAVNGFGPAKSAGWDRYIAGIRYGGKAIHEKKPSDSACLRRWRS
jgi:hypothetical protein